VEWEGMGELANAKLRGAFEHGRHGKDVNVKGNERNFKGKMWRMSKTKKNVCAKRKWPNVSKKLEWLVKLGRTNFPKNVHLCSFFSAFVP
jgi:hypothetical protein